METHSDIAQMRLCGGCGTKWYSGMYCSAAEADCDDCGSPLIKSADSEVVASAASPSPIEAAPPPDPARIELVFGPFLWLADDAG